MQNSKEEIIIDRYANFKLKKEDRKAFELRQQRIARFTKYGEELVKKFSIILSNFGNNSFNPDNLNENLNFHQKYYHPSNSFIYLYGNMDMAEKLAFIDEKYLSAVCSFMKRRHAWDISPEWIT